MSASVLSRSASSRLVAASALRCLALRTNLEERKILKLIKPLLLLLVQPSAPQTGLAISHAQVKVKGESIVKVEHFCLLFSYMTGSRVM